MIKKIWPRRIGKLALLAVSVWLTAVARPAWTQTTPPAGGSQAAAPSSASGVASPEEVVLTVGTKKITAAEFEKIISSLPPQYSGAAATLGKKAFADQFANLLGLALEGEKRKLDQQEGFRQMMDFQRLLLLAQIALNDLASSTGPVSPEDVRNYYTTHQVEFEEAKVRGIYVAFEADSAPGEADKSSESSQEKEGAAQQHRTEPEAKVKAEALRARIQAGEDMAALAKTESDHATATQSGDFGYVRREQLTPEMSDAIFPLSPNQVSAPVRDRFGYFIFQVEGKRVQPLEQVQANIENNLRQQKTGDLLTKIRNDYPVALNPRYFPETPSGIPPQAQPTR
ncbi:MAG: peptidylprolyl isomerase [Acidobacteria bacterium]|nr:peptidylprolyl isomerase [Acidobacteriota bacterium]